MEATDQLLQSELKRDEGVRYKPYKDTENVLTVGVGHNLIAKPLGLIYPLKDDEVNSILYMDIADTFHALDKHLPWWRTLSYSRQRVIANMAFNLGIAGLLEFKKMLDAAKLANYPLAAKEMMDSKWAKQVGDRAKRLEQLMIKG